MLRRHLSCYGVRFTQGEENELGMEREVRKAKVSKRVSLGYQRIVCFWDSEGILRFSDGMSMTGRKGAFVHKFSPTHL